jgi:hypothetical protein
VARIALQELSQPRRVLGTTLALWRGVLLFLLGVGSVLKVSHQFSRGAVLCFVFVGPARLLNSALAGRQLARRQIALVTGTEFVRGDMAASSRSATRS